MKFEEKVKSMSANEIIMAMVNGLQNPKVKIDMSTYGEVREKKILGLISKEVCYGCAATNAVCEVAGIKFTPKTINFRSERKLVVDSSWDFLSLFEFAINALRLGKLTEYNHYAHRGGFAEIVGKPKLELPELGTDYKKSELNEYVKLADYQTTLANL